MTLCKYRPQRTYDAQFLLDHNDVRGLLKKTRETANDTGSPYYVGAAVAFETLFRDAELFGEVDMWRDFIERFAANLGEELKGGCE